MLRLPGPIGGYCPQSVTLPFLRDSGGADMRGRKRWGEYKTDEPDAHGGFGKTDGFSKYRTNVDCCHPIPEKTDFDGNAGHMFPRALVKYDMNKETLIKSNHNRRFKQNPIHVVFPLNDPDRSSELGVPVLTTETRQGLDYNSQRFYQSTRNQRVFLDHTAEIRKRVAEKIRLKRIDELKTAIRLKAFLNPTPELWEQYREICSLTYQNHNDNDNREGEESVKDETGQQGEISREDDSCHLSYLPSIQNTETRDTTTQMYLPRSSSTTAISKPLKGILKTCIHYTNQFVRPWAEHNLTMAISTWRPPKRCNQRPSRRVRFTDEVFPSMEEKLFKRIRPPTPHVVSFFPKSLNLEAQEFEVPEDIYYDKDLCKNISSRLGLPFKTEACKRFHQKYTDPIPDLRDFRQYPRKHFFNGHHTSVLRG